MFFPFPLLWVVPSSLLSVVSGLSCTFLYLCTNDGVVHACAVCVTVSVDRSQGVHVPQTHIKGTVLLHVHIYISHRLTYEEVLFYCTDIFKYYVAILWAVKRQISMLFIDNTDSGFCRFDFFIKSHKHRQTLSSLSKNHKASSQHLN